MTYLGMNCSTSWVKHFFGGAIICIASSTLFAQDFGVAHWGMTEAEIQQLELRPNLTPFQATNYLIYQVDISGVQQARLVYQFQNGQLAEGRFLFRTVPKHDANQAIQHWQVINDMMTRQYGPPMQQQILSKDGNTQGINDNDWANELASDRLILKQSWQTATTLIQHQLAWSGNHPHHQLWYRPISSASQTNGSNF